FALILRNSQRPRESQPSEESFLPSQVPEGADVRQAEGEAKLVLVTDRAERETAIFEAEAAAVPVVGGLDGTVLQKAPVCVESKAGSSRKPSLVGIAIPE